MVSEVDIGWLAGILDGEGSVVLSHLKTGEHVAQVNIYGTDSTLMRKVQNVVKRLGGYTPAINSRRRKKGLSNRPELRLNVSRKLVLLKILSLLMPHLTAKKVTAKKLLRYCEKTKHRGIGRPRGSKNGQKKNNCGLCR